MVPANSFENFEGGVITENVDFYVCFVSEGAIHLDVVDSRIGAIHNAKGHESTVHTYVIQLKNYY